jgi:hypothetical protein
VALPTGLTSITPAENRDYHTQLAAALPQLDLPSSYTDASTGHLGHHATLQAYFRAYGVAVAPVENEAGHAAAHNRLHTFTNVLVGPYGPDAAYTQPAGSVSVSVGSLNQALLDAHPTGTKFWLATGTHRPAAEITTMLVPKANQELHGASGAVLSGSVVLSSWTPDAGRWYATAQTQRGVDGPELYAGTAISPADHPRAWKSEAVYIDGVIQKHQNALADVGAGEWYFDYAANRIYIGTDPAGKTVETTMADRAVVGGGGGVVLRNLIVEKFMSPLQVAAVDNAGQTGWQVLDCEVRLNHGCGTKIGDGGTVRGCKIHANGELGAAGGGTGMVFEDNELSRNNSMLINRGFEGGGSKFVFSTNASCRRNWVHHNRGNGLWFDISNTDPVMADNLVEDNDWIGLFQEIGYGGVIEWNLTRNNGLDYTTFAPLGGGIVVTDTNAVQVRYNSVIDNRGGGIWGLRDSRAGGAEGYELRDLNVHDNLIVMASNLGGGTDPPGNGIQDFTAAVPAVLPAANNRWQNNTYLVTSLSTTFWYWLGGPKTWAQWQAIPQDTTGTATVEALPEVAAGSLVAWYDTQHQGIYVQGDPVSSVGNLMGVAGALTQGTAASKPLWQIAGINGRPAVRHDGTDDALATAAFGTLETQPNTVVMVVRLVTTGAGMVLLDGNGATNRHLIQIDNASQQWQIWAGAFISSTGQSLNTTPHILRALFNGASSSLWVDDVQVATGNPGAAALGGVTVGSYSNAGAGYAPIDWGQILVYAGDISGNWAALRDHLLVKWGI